MGKHKQLSPQSLLVDTNAASHDHVSPLPVHISFSTSTSSPRFSNGRGNVERYYVAASRVAYISDCTTHEHSIVAWLQALLRALIRVPAASSPES